MNGGFSFPISTIESFDELERYLCDTSKFNSDVSDPVISVIFPSFIYLFTSDIE